MAVKAAAAQVDTWSFSGALPSQVRVLVVTCSWGCSTVDVVSASFAAVLCVVVSVASAMRCVAPKFADGAQKVTPPRAQRYAVGTWPLEPVLPTPGAGQLPDAGLTSHMELVFIDRVTNFVLPSMRMPVYMYHFRELGWAGS